MPHLDELPEPRTRQPAREGMGWSAGALENSAYNKGGSPPTCTASAGVKRSSLPPLPPLLPVEDDLPRAKARIEARAAHCDAAHESVCAFGGKVGPRLAQVPGARLLNGEALEL